MLTLQRASAGSGKTYTLTKKFIRLLISITDSGGKARLRTDAELRDALSHILAITFTNKATAEMKERIISRLNDLAYNVDPENPNATDYLADFMEEFNAGAEEIGRVCGIALRRLLYDFADFNVQTIDSFFQAILRTFAYEAELPDGYELVINNDFINRQAVDSMVESFADSRIEKSTGEWIRRLIRQEVARGGRDWNIFSRKESSGRSHTLFTEICRMADDLDKESNKHARGAIDRYFDSGADLLQDFKDIDAMFRGELNLRFGRMRDAAASVREEFERISSAPMKGTLRKGSTISGRLDDILAPDAEADGLFNWQMEEWHENNIADSKLKAADRRSFAASAGALIASLDAMNKAHADWKEYLTRHFMLWKIFSDGYPRMALIHDMSGRIEEILYECGAMKISDTNTMLRRIIADDDVPFIYERFGTRLRHFLIDEFQDTSLMQWENIVPLLRESESHDYENLIIGDAKQSIYRFRSAEPKLITHIVPEEFSGRDERGYALMENANRRSMRRIVEFNNFIFRNLSAALSPETASLYGNTVQFPANRSPQGYVEFSFIQKGSSISKNERDTPIDPSINEKIGPLIISLLERGYRQREIAILVNRNSEGMHLISSLIEFNKSLPAGSPVLEFVSEDSLNLSSSEAVGIVVSCLRMIQNGMEGRISGPEEERSGSGKGNERICWRDVAAHFRFHSMKNPGMSLPERMRTFFEGDFEGDLVAKVLEEMHAVTLPSLVEALTETFVPEELRSSQAVFLAALQDAVLDYCEVYPSDIGSFLRWWEKRGSKMSISSPEDTDAISVMTIHKAKGLEFECVILPAMDFDMDFGGEWTWVDVPDDFPSADRMPSCVPILLRPFNSEERKAGYSWDNTPYGDMLREKSLLNMIDQLNKAYVAMTRPVSELYAFLPIPGPRSGSRLSRYLYNILKGDITAAGGSSATEIGIADGMDIPATDTAKEESMIATLSDIHSEEVRERRDSDSLLLREFNGIAAGCDTDAAGADAESGEGEKLVEEIFRYGEKYEDVAASLEKRRKKKESSAELRGVDTYFVNSDRPILHYHEENTRPCVHEADDDRIDPRSEGSLLHAVLENVEVEEDLPKAFERLRLRGLISREQIKEYRPLLEKALKSVRDRGWFDGSSRVFAERALLKRGEIMHRPDRAMLRSDGALIVIDYKFGGTEKRSLHQKQVRGYMKRLAEYTRASSVEGYVWYVAGNKIEPVALNESSRS